MTKTKKRIEEAINTLFELREDLTEEDIFNLDQLQKS